MATHCFWPTDFGPLLFDHCFWTAVSGALLLDPCFSTTFFRPLLLGHFFGPLFLGRCFWTTFLYIATIITKATEFPLKYREIVRLLRAIVAGRRISRYFRGNSFVFVVGFWSLSPWRKLPLISPVRKARQIYYKSGGISFKIS